MTWIHAAWTRLANMRLRCKLDRLTDPMNRNVSLPLLPRLKPPLTPRPRNEKHLAPPRPLLHLPPLLLPPLDRPGMGPRLLGRRLTHPTHRARLHLRPLPRHFSGCVDCDVLSRRQVAGSRCARMARQEETRALWTARESAGRAVGVWVLF